VSPGGDNASIDELLDRAVGALNRGDRETATALAGQVLAVDRGNLEAEDLLTASDKPGEIRRLTLMFVDLVDSTVLSTQVEPETYRTLVARYRQDVMNLVDHYGGHISSTKGDGLLAVFGHPKAHEDDARRAVAVGLDITRAVAQLSEQAQRRFGVTLTVRVGVHRGLVYLDTAADDVFGFAVNLTQRISTLAEPGSVAASDAVAALVSGAFELTGCPAVVVKGVDEAISHHRVVAERPQSPRLQSLPLVGRTRERACLQSTWQQLRNSASRRVGVAFRGEPGIGKTRLTHAAAEMVEQSDGAVIELRGSPLHTDTGLHPVRRLLERRCGITRLTEGADRLRLLEAELLDRAMDPATTVPLLAPVLGVAPEYGYDPVAVEGRSLYELIGATVHRYVLACLNGRPGLVVAEDVHWFDPSTMELLNSLFTGVDGQLLVVLAGRDGSWLRTDWPVTLFDLTPLTDEESDALIEALHPAATDAQRAAVRNRCDGVPFYIEHVVAGLDAADGQVPEALYESLFARLHTRTDVVPVVEAAAVIGRGGDLALLRSVVEGEVDVDGVVAELVRTRVFESEGADRWRFRHELLREVAAELAPPSLRRELHARAARALVDAASGAEPDWRVVARHYERAQRFDDAVAAYQKASVDARRRGALQETLACLTNALDQLEGCTAGPGRDRAEFAIRLERGFLTGAVHGGTSGEGPADFERCLELSSIRMHENELFVTLAALLSYYVPRAELRKAHDLLESLSNRIPQGWQWCYPAIASSRGAIIWLKGDFKAARGHLLQGLADRSAADPRELDAAWWMAHDPIAMAHWYLALTHTVCGDLDRARAELAESVHRCETLGFPQNAYSRAHTYFTEIWVCLETGDLYEATNLVAEMRRRTEDAGLDMWRIVSAMEHATIRALVALRAGADAATLIAKAEKISQFVDASRYMHLNVYLTVKDAVIGRLLVAAGQLEKARERLDLALSHAEKTGMQFYDAELMRIRAHTFTEQHTRCSALAAAREFARYQGSTLFELRCMLDSFDLFGDGDRPELAEAVRHCSVDARWPEHARAERILS
jgi:class 3 adenylate cyclase/tetratricopeptide (TPR) repeat protein